MKRIKKKTKHGIGYRSGRRGTTARHARIIFGQCTRDRETHTRCLSSQFLVRSSFPVLSPPWPANFAGATLVSRHRSLHTSRVSADRKRNEKVERANPGNRVTHRQKSDRKEREGGIATAMCPMRSDSPFSKRIRRVVIRNCLRIFHFCWIECA